MLLRVLSVHDAREWLLPLPEGAQHIQVADVKRLVRQQQQQAVAAAATGVSHSEAADDSESFVVFRGRFLADVDVVDLNALAAADFLVLAQEQPVPPEDGDEEEEKEEKEVKDENESLVQQLAAMGFDVVRARVAVRRAGGDLAAAIALLTGDKRVPISGVNVAHRNPQLRALQPALDELEALRVRQAAATDGFRAIMRLKEFAPTTALEQLNAHPAEAVAYWRLPLERADGMEEKELTEETKVDDSSADHAAEDADVIDRVRGGGVLSMDPCYVSCSHASQVAPCYRCSSRPWASTATSSLPCTSPAASKRKRRSTRSARCCSEWCVYVLLCRSMIRTC